MAYKEPDVMMTLRIPRRARRTSAEKLAVALREAGFEVEALRGADGETDEWEATIFLRYGEIVCYKHDMGKISAMTIELA